MKIAHLADLHFGRIAHPRIVEALIEDVNGLGADLVALSGDLTQRARPREYRQAAAFIGKLKAPVLVVPGNHDMYPWWHPVHRLTLPRRRFDRWITARRYPSFEKEGLAVLGISSATGFTVKRGFVRRRTCAKVREYYGGAPAEAFKVLVVHHPPARLVASGAGESALGGRGLLEAAARAGVRLVLSGHWHVSHVGQVMAAGGHLVLAHAGTAASDRRRAPQKGLNSYHVVQVESGTFSIAERSCAAGALAFVAGDVREYLR